MKQLLITIAALVLVGCGGDDSEKVREVTTTILSEKAKVDIKMKHRDGHMLLKLKVYQFKGIIEKNYNQNDNAASFKIIFTDKDEFEVTSQIFQLEDMLMREDQHLEIDLRRTMSKEKYDLIKHTTIGVAGFIE